MDEITTGPKFVSLTDFIEEFDSEYSDLDTIDRREIKHLDGENFWRYIGKSDVPLEEPGHLSPVTMAKAIEYGVSLLGSFIEGYVGSNQALGKEADAGFPAKEKWGYQRRKVLREVSLWQFLKASGKPPGQGSR